MLLLPGNQPVAQSPSRRAATGSWYGPSHNPVWVPAAPSPSSRGGQAAAQTTPVGTNRYGTGSALAAEMFAQGQAGRAARMDEVLGQSRTNVLSSAQGALGPGQSYIGVDVTAPGYQPVYLGGYSAADAVALGQLPSGTDPSAMGGNYYQAPEYIEGQEWEAGYSMNEDQLADFRAKAVQAGLLDDSVVLGSVFGPADADVMRNLMYMTNTSSMTTWDQVLDDLIGVGGNPDNLFGPGGAGNGQPEGPTTTTSVTYQKTGVDTGRAILRDLMRSMLGREATDAEVRRYVGALNRAEDNNPQVVETVSDAANNRTTTRTLETAPDVGEFLYGQVEKKNAPEVFTYRANDFMSIVERLA